MAKHNPKFRHLTDEQVIDIRNRATPDNIGELAQLYGVYPMSIRNAARGYTYEHLNDVAAPIDLPRKKRLDGLTDIQKQAIKDKKREGKSLSELAREYNVTAPYISLIINDKR